MRLDPIQLRTICRALRTTLPAFVTKLEECLEKKPKQNKGCGSRLTYKEKRLGCVRQGDEG